MPNKLLPLLIDLLQPKLPESAHVALTRCAALTQTALGAEDHLEAQTAAEELEGMVEDVRQLGLSKGRAE